jgi:glycine cleavage system aminomethyltransferase T
MADAAPTSAATPPLRKTALHATHVALGARMVPFGGWDMPVEYSGITAEHLAVRERVGLFDVSHMGEIEIAGADALAAVQKLTSNDAAKLAVGKIQYSSLPTPEGTVVDDVLVYRSTPATSRRTGAGSRPRSRNTSRVAATPWPSTPVPATRSSRCKVRVPRRCSSR